MPTRAPVCTPGFEDRVAVKPRECCCCAAYIRRGERLSNSETVEEEERVGGSKSGEGDEKVQKPEEESRLWRSGRTLCVLFLIVKGRCPAGEGEGRLRLWYWDWDQGIGEVC